MQVRLTTRFAALARAMPGRPAAPPPLAGAPPRPPQPPGDSVRWRTRARTVRCEPHPPRTTAPVARQHPMSWNAPASDAPASAPHEPSGRTPYLTAVRAAWRHAREAADPFGDGLALALCLFARDGRARGVPVDTLLQTLDGLVRSGPDGTDQAGTEQLRAWVGAQVIRAYYGAD